MRKILRTILLYTASLYITSLLLPGIIVRGGLEDFVIGGAFLTLGHYIIKPILNVLTLPLKLITFGLFSFVVNGITLFIISLLYEKLHVSSFTFPPINLPILHTPSFFVPLPLSYIIISATIYAILRILSWVFEE